MFLVWKINEWKEWVYEYLAFIHIRWNYHGTLSSTSLILTR